MARKRKQLPILENITIEQVAAEGKALARIPIEDNNEEEVKSMVVFVQFAVPGDVVDIQLTKKRHSYAEGRIIKFRKKSDVREEPKCDHFGICGGCKWQNLPYEKQIEAKQQQVYDQLSRIGKIELPEFHKILGSKKIFEYRNKLEFGCSNKRWLTAEEIGKGDDILEKNAIGFHITGAFDKIYPIEKCCLMDNLHNEIRNFIYQYALDNSISFFDLKQQNGLLRSLMIRNSNSGEWMLLVQFHYDEQDDDAKARTLMQAIANKFPQITSLLYVDNQKCNDTFGDLPINVYKGNDHIFEIMEDLKFKVGPKSFYQTNTDQAYQLYSVTRKFANLTGEELVYDLYTGTGTIANFVARHAKKVIGIEYVPEAIEDAKINSQLNGIENTLFYAGDMKDILTEDFIKKHGRPDVIITDPPRAGMHSDVVSTILLAAPKRIVYVSCNPATQARDMAIMDETYKVAEVQPVDMFPHTPHVENVVLLERRL